MSFKPAAIALSLKNAWHFQLHTIHDHRQKKRPTPAPPSPSPPPPPPTATSTIVETVTPAVITTGTSITYSTTDTNCTTTVETVPPTVITTASTTMANPTTAENNTVVTFTSCDDLIQLFMYGNKLAALSLHEKRSAVVGLTTYCASSPAHQPLPAVVVTNLVRMFAYTPELFPAVCGPVLDEVLMIVTSDPCAGLSGMPWNVRERFVEATLSLSAGVLYRVPRAAFAAVLRTAAALTASRPRALPRPAVENMVTSLSLSSTTFHCLPPATLEWVLRVTVDHPDMWARLPVSTTAAFVDGLLRAVAADRRATESRGRAPSLATVLDQAMTVRLLGVLSVDHFDLLLDTDALHAATLERVFVALTAAPVLLNRVNPDRLVHVLLTVTTGPSSDSVTRNVVNHLLHAMDDYSPQCLARLPDEWRAYWSD